MPWEWTGHLPAVHDRHHQVEHDEVGTGGGHQGEGLVGIAGDLHVVVTVAEDVGDEVAAVLFVVDHQDTTG
jgi:hypothetical protein